jgi:hypothetical protein
MEKRTIKAVVLAAVIGALVSGCAFRKAKPDGRTEWVLPAFGYTNGRWQFIP